MNTHAQVFVENYAFSFSWSELLSYMVTLNFLRACCFPKWLHQFAIPPAMYEDASLPISSLTFVIVYFTLAILVGIKRFLSCFPLMANDIEQLHLLISHLSIFFGEIYFQIHWPCLNWVICLFVVKKVVPFWKFCLAAWNLNLCHWSFHQYFCRSNVIV